MGASSSKSKKRSGASSKSKPPEPVVFFLDRSLGSKIIARALRDAGLDVHVHDDHFPPDALDEDWLPTVGQRGWVVLTKDTRIRYRAAELAAVRRANVRLFSLIAKDLQGPEMAQIFVRAVPSIRRLVQRTPAPFLAKITRSASVSLWVSPGRGTGRER
ncbi:MAG: hypothetical protein ACRD35_08465 [Candidatus Acidiferrales bacterium]